MREDQRLGIRTLAAHVDEVDRHTVDLGAKMRIRIDRTLLLAPVVTLDPVGDQFLEVGGVRAVLPAVVCEVVGPAREFEARPKIVEHFIGYIDAKRLHDVLLRQIEFQRLHGQCFIRGAYSSSLCGDSDLKPARISSERNFGCSQAAK